MRAPARARRLAALLACLALLASACGSPSESVRADAVAGSVAVTFRSADGVELAGRLFGDPAAQAFTDQARAPRRLEIVTSDDHGTDLVTGNQAEIVRNLLLSQLAQYAPA